MYVNKLQIWWIKIHTFVIFINWQDGRYDIWEFGVYQDFNLFDLYSFNHTLPDTYKCLGHTYLYIFEKK